MNDNVTHHREAARIFRESVKDWEKKGKRRRANFFREQANWHEREANRLEDSEDLIRENQDLFLLLAKEIFPQTGEVYQIEISPYMATVFFRHPFMGISLFCSMAKEDVPEWIAVVENIPWPQVDKEGQYRVIDRYLRPLNPREVVVDKPK